MKSSVISGIIVILCMAITSCVYRHVDEPIPQCNPKNLVSFKITISSILNTKCDIAGCHNGSNSYVPYLNTLSEVKANANDILSQIENHAMPPSGRPQLTAFELAEIECWINQGANTP